MGSIPNGSAGEDEARVPGSQGFSEPEASQGASPADASEALSPAVAGALEEGYGTLAERLALIEKHSPRGQRYDLLSEVGKGAMGRVLRVWDRVLQRELALKLVHVTDGVPVDQAERANLDRRTTRFIEEARITGQLAHPGIVPVHELAFDEQGQLYFAMPLVRGHTLTRIFEMVHEKQQGWTLRRAVDVLHKVCLTLAFAHSKGVVHRDLKPDNIMVGPFGESYVMDWGLALIQGKSEHASFLGTPGYMAPEQIDAPQLVGPASDVYALGAILYRLLKGDMPHQATLDDNQAGFVDWSELVASTPRSIDFQEEGVPPELVAICERAMHRDIKERYASAMELAAEIESWMEGRVVQAHDTNKLTRLKKWSLRNAALFHALAAIVIIVPLGLGMLLILQNSKVREVQAKNLDISEKTYRLGLTYAKRDMRVRDLSLALASLQECPPELRGWEWYHLLQGINGGAEVLVRESNSVLSVAMAGAVDRMATGSDDGEIRVFWDSKTARLISKNKQAIHALVFHPSQSFLVAASEDTSVRIWNAADGELVREFLDHEKPVHCLALNAKGTLLASGDGGGMLHLRRLPSGELLARVPTGPLGVTALAFDPLGEDLVVCTSAPQIMRWNLKQRSFTQVQSEPGSSIKDCLMGPQGTRLYVASGREISVLNARDFSLRGSLVGHATAVTALALDSAGERLLSASMDGSLRVWDLKTNELLQEFVGHSEEVNDVAFLPGSERFLSVSEDETARIWTPGSQAELKLGSHGDWVEGLSFDPSGTRLASAGRDGSLRIWNANDGSLLQLERFDGPAYGLAWSSEQRLLVQLGDASLRTLIPGQESSLEVLAAAEEPLVAILSHPGSGRLIARYLDNSLKLWNRESEAPRYTIHVEDTFAYSQAFHPSGESFAIGLNDGRVRLRSSSEGQPIGLLEGRDDSAIMSLAFSPDGLWLAAGNVNRQIFIWDLASGELLRAMEGHESQVTSLAFSPDGTRLVSGSVDRTVRIWEPARGELLLTLDDHESGITAVCFDPRGTQIASASKDGVLRLWRAGSSESLRR